MEGGTFLLATTGLNAALVPLGCGSVLSPLSPSMLLSSSFLEQGDASAITSQAHVCGEKRLAAKGANEAQPSGEDTHHPGLLRAASQHIITSCESWLKVLPLHKLVTHFRAIPVGNKSHR